MTNVGKGRRQGHSHSATMLCSLVASLALPLLISLPTASGNFRFLSVSGATQGSAQVCQASLVQSKASVIQTNSSLPPCIAADEVPALQAFVSAFPSANLTDYGWNAPWPCNNVTGIVCDDQGHITDLIMPGQMTPSCDLLPLNTTSGTPLNCPYERFLWGTLPAKISLLSALTRLDLKDQHLEDPFPTSFFTLTNLQFLNLRINYVTLPMDPGFSKFINLHYLSYGNAASPGTPFPTFISTLSKLSYLDFNGAMFEGTLPDFWDSLPSLAYLNLPLNFLRGPIPPSFSALTNLTFFEIRPNYLNGTLPAFLGNFTKLEFLALGQNNFSGSVPDTLTKLTNLNFLDLSYNKFLQGTLSPGFAKLPNISPVENGLGMPYFQVWNTSLYCPPSTASLCSGVANTSTQFCLYVCNSFCGNCSAKTYAPANTLKGEFAGNQPQVAPILPPPSQTSSSPSLSPSASASASASASPSAPLSTQGTVATAPPPKGASASLSSFLTSALAALVLTAILT